MSNIQDNTGDDSVFEEIDEKSDITNNIDDTYTDDGSVINIESTGYSTSNNL